MNDKSIQSGITRSDRRLAFTGFFVGSLLAILILLPSQPFNDPGALWHIRVGDWIIQHASLPHTDPFTWSYAGKPWIPQQWGAECTISLLHRLGGFDALLLGMAALLATMAARIAMRFLDAGLHWMPTGAIVALGMAVAGFHFYLRPHLATIVLMAEFMACFVDFERGRISVKRLFWLVPLCAFWANLHGGVLGGIFTLAIAICGWALFKVQSARTLGVLILILLACLPATFVNPFGLEMHRTWWRIIGSKVVKEVIVEHQALDIARTDGQAVVGFGCFYLVMLLGTLAKRPRIVWLIPIVWFVLSLSSIRHGPLFCVIALVALADMLPETIWFRLLRKYGDTFVREPVSNNVKIGPAGWGIVVAIVVLSLCLQIARVPIPAIGFGWARFDKRMVPMELIEPLQEYEKTRPEGFPVFNEINLGGFLIYFTPRLRVFIDDRFELFGDEGINDYIDLANEHPERIEQWAEKSPFDRALVQCDTKLDQYLKNSEHWREVARCTKAALYERVGR